MLDQPNVFLSSTMQSLRHLRSGIHDKLGKSGFVITNTEPNDLSITPGHSLKEICQENVDRSDLFVLVLDGNYGTPFNGEWLVKCEFERARAKGKPIFVFLEERAMHSFELAKAHPEQPPSSYGVHADVLKFFLEDIQFFPILTFRSTDDLGNALQARLMAHFAQVLREKSRWKLIQITHLIENMNTLYRQDKYVQAMLASEEVLRHDSQNVEALIVRSVAKIRLHGMNDGRSIEEGIRDCKVILEQEPMNYRARYNLANFKLLSPTHTTKDVRNDLESLFKDFPEYRIFFEKDLEFNRMLLLRESWAVSNQNDRATSR
jgi:hypothetical protein